MKAGDKVFVQTVTHYFTGEVVMRTKSDIVLRKAAWIADTGRFAQAMANGALNEVEPFPDETIVRVNRGSIIQIATWPHPLPRAQK